MSQNKNNTPVTGKYTPTEIQIENWRKTHGDVFCYEIDGMACYLRRPDRKVISAATTLGKNDPMKFAEVIIDNSWLGGNPELKTMDKYFMGLQQQVGELVEVKVGELKKL